jgi:hypothetical protein
MAQKKKRQSYLKQLKAIRASRRQAEIEDEMALLEMARKRMEHYQSEGWSRQGFHRDDQPGPNQPVPDLVETMKYSMRRDPGSRRRFRPDTQTSHDDEAKNIWHPLPLPENIPTNFTTGLGYQVDKDSAGVVHRSPTVTANYVRNAGLGGPAVPLPVRNVEDIPFDTVNIDKELTGVGRVTSADIARDPNLSLPSLEVPADIGDIRMHERMHKASDHAFRSPFFEKERGRFLGGGHPEKTKQEEYNEFIKRGGSPQDRLHSREHEMVYTATQPLDPRHEASDVRTRRDVADFVKMIGSGYGEYNKETGQYEGKSGLAARQVEAYRKDMTEKELYREYCNLNPDDPICASRMTSRPYYRPATNERRKRKKEDDYNK